MSFKPELQVRENGVDNWYPNALAFETREEALSAAEDTYSRWMMARGFRAVESDQPVNYRWENGQLIAVNASPVESTTS